MSSSDASSYTETAARDSVTWPDFMNIPFNELESDTLTAIIEEYISREGTDYGVHEITLEQKVEQVMSQLQRGEVVVTFDPESQSCDLQVVAER